MRGISIANEDAFTTGKELAKAEGVLVGISSVQLYMLQSSLQNARKTKENNRCPSSGQWRPLLLHSIIRRLKKAYRRKNR